jgi:hypothetical protein
MKRRIRLTESQLVSLIQRIVEEEKYSEEDLTFPNEVYGKDCIIRAARKKRTNMPGREYGAVVLCDVNDTGNLFVVGELTVFGKTEEEVNQRICQNIEQVKAEYDELFQGEEETLMESIESSRWDVSDRPISCDFYDQEYENPWEYRG